MYRVFVDFLTEYFEAWLNFHLGIKVIKVDKIFNRKTGGV